MNKKNSKAKIATESKNIHIHNTQENTSSDDTDLPKEQKTSSQKKSIKKKTQKNEQKKASL